MVALIGAGCHIQGDLTCEGRVRIDGYFKGRIYTNHSIEVGITGVVDGKIDAAVAVVAGQLIGTARIRERLVVKSSGIIQGELIADQDVVEVQPGGRITGDIHFVTNTQTTPI